MKKILLISAALSVTILMSGCVITPSHEPYYSSPVRMAPPPPYSEYPGHPPMAGYLWVSGYWNWIGTRYDWFPGHWVSPRPGYLWVPHRWERNGEHWQQQGGRWEQDNRHHSEPAPVRVEQATEPRRDYSPREERTVPPQVNREPKRSPDKSNKPPSEYEQRGRPERTDGRQSRHRDADEGH